MLHVGSNNLSKRLPKTGSDLALSGGDDGTVRVWSFEQRGSIHILPHRYPVTSAVFDESGDKIITGSVDNLIRVRVFA